MRMRTHGPHTLGSHEGSRDDQVPHAAVRPMSSTKQLSAGNQFWLARIAHAIRACLLASATEALFQDFSSRSFSAHRLLGSSRAQLIGDAVLLIHEPFAYPMDKEHGLLIRILDGHESHLRTADGLADGGGIVAVVLAGSALASIRHDQ